MAMQRIIIHNFGAIKSADIEIKKITVLIGEQASGKSTIAKLIYFFKTLKDDIFSQIHTEKERDFDTLSGLIDPIRNKFYNFFGSTLHLSPFDITYYYNSYKYIQLLLNEKHELVVQLDTFIDDSFIISTNSIKSNILNFQFKRTYQAVMLGQAWKMISNTINALFESKQTDILYVIAGRNATVSYSNLFEKYLFANMQSQIEENSKQIIQRKRNTIDEILMLEFMEKVIIIKDTFKKFDSFEGLIENYAKDETVKKLLHEVKITISKILKGKYTVDKSEEKIVINDITGESISLSNASSGQQEVVRILQDIFLTILDNNKVMRILEEPEAHLFPVAQKQLIELLAVMVNNNEDTQLVITTHSPYVLTVFNNLLFAKRVVTKNNTVSAEVHSIIPAKYCLDVDNFSAYSLGNSEQDSPYCESIIDDTTKLIAENYLDEVSELLGSDFNALYAIHSKKFARR
jgi:predicted ATPase